jgi:hypothetical protein
MAVAALKEIRRVGFLINHVRHVSLSRVEIGATLLSIVPSGTADASKRCLV